MRHNGLELVKNDFSRPKLVVALQDGVGQFGGVDESGRQTSDFVTGQDDVVAVDTRQNGTRLVTDADDFNVFIVFSQLVTDVTSDGGVDGTAQT